MKKFIWLALFGLLLSLPFFGAEAATLAQRVSGRILLQVEEHGESWYVYPVTGKKVYLPDGDSAYGLMRTLGLGITNENLNKIPIGLDSRLLKVDTDKDGLDDTLEAGLGTSDVNADSDGDGYSDGSEVRDGYNPTGAGKFIFDSALVNRLRGRIVLQIEQHGEAWYIYPVDGKRYYLANGIAAYSLMRTLGLGITDVDLGKIPVDNSYSEIYLWKYHTGSGATPGTYAYVPTSPLPALPADTTAGPTMAKSLLLGLVNFHYYGDLGGNTGATFRADQAWAASTIDLGIINWSDDGMKASWREIKSDQPKGKWLKWRLAQVINTNEAAGSCAAPRIGADDPSLAYQQDEFSRFLSDYKNYGDGETCFLHAQNAGTITPRWHTQDCSPTLSLSVNSRIKTIIWNQYGWLLDVSSDCATDFMAWRTIKDIRDEGYGGVGFDNLGSPMADGYYLPLPGGSVKIAEIPDNVEANPAALDDWWYSAIESLLETVNNRVQAVYFYSANKPKIVYNGGAYCSWDGSVPKLQKIAGGNLGVWCEDALEYPGWGSLGTAERLRSLLTLSNNVYNEGGFVALETFYNRGNDNPTAAEIMFYLSAYYSYKNPADVLALKPDWSPYQPMKETLWFEVFNRDLGSPLATATENSNGVFSRDYYRSDGQRALVLVRPAGNGTDGGAYTLDANYCRVGADNRLSPVSGSVTVNVGDGIILLKKGLAGVSC
ncbi:hypothetical protein HY933_02095 [Candidatus Falkowbacteria bacterium]|nr:hypothetical protein [Candidatus Falkowbacteria bacterium]